MARVVTSIDAVRARFTALQRPLAFFDGPGGTQVPDSVIDAIADYLRESNANLGGPFETSRRSEALVAHAHETAAELPERDRRRGRVRREHDDDELRALARRRA